MARRKQNPIKDIGNQVGSWLGGAARAYADITDSSRDNQPGRLPQVQAALNATRAIGKVVDTATGGFGSAVVSDAQRMAKTGSSTPSALYKTAAVNLAAAAAGGVAGSVAGKVVSNVRGKVGREVGVHLSDVANLRNVTYQASRAGSGLGRQVEVGKTYKFAPRIGTGTEGRMTADTFARRVAAENVNLSQKSGMAPKSFAYVTKSRVGEIDPAYGAWSNARMVGSQRVVDRAALPKSGDVEEVRKQVYAALVRQERVSARNVRAGVNVVRGGVGVGVQQTGVRKGRGGRNKR